VVDIPTGWLQLLTYLTSGTAMIITATWFLAGKINEIRVNLEPRVASAEIRLAALEQREAQRAIEDRAFQTEMRAGHIETIRSLSELKAQLAVFGKAAGG
jgi:hypothetical protein